ncbi:hypothetical protein NDU88_005720 [Pleurodeles waltl]|uniref:Uncharacterized protein n=1 Tax=Pleurodeles waltl TaxID=8319 RepID=A0AAV7TBX2_PLEWA|nr:hypothetical protein NDU88_005720 [Pleurodeles waltl]
MADVLQAQGAKFYRRRVVTYVLQCLCSSGGRGGRKSQPRPASRSRDPISPTAHLLHLGVPWLMPLNMSHAAPIGNPRSRLLDISASPGQVSTGAAQQSDALDPASTEAYCQSF